MEIKIMTPQEDAFEDDDPKQQRIYNLMKSNMYYRKRIKLLWSGVVFEAILIVWLIILLWR
jgi:hypothetical protein